MGLERFILAIHLSLVPAGFNTSQLYGWTVTQYENGIDSWELQYLLQKFDAEEIQNMLNRGYLVKIRNEHVKLGFKVIGTLVYNVSKFAAREINCFTELLTKLPKNARCSGNKLRECLVFLTNFGIIECFTLPASAITCVVANNERSDAVDRLFSWGFYIENKYLYQVNANEGITEWLEGYNGWGTSSV